MAVIGINTNRIKRMRHHQDQFFIFGDERRLTTPLANRRAMVFIGQYGHILKETMEEIGIMAKKSEPKFVWNGYANVDIPESKVEACEAYIDDTKAVWADFVTAVQCRYTIKFQYDEKSESYRATLTCHDSSSDNFGMALSAWGTDVFVAMGALLYKHFHISSQSWKEYKSTGSKSFG